MKSKYQYLGHLSLINSLLKLIVLVLISIPIYMSMYWNRHQPEHNPTTAVTSSNKEITEDVLARDTGYEVVKANCTSCHSSRLIAQNKATREGWERTIRWMQQTQNLWDLGENETIILDYLAKHYAPKQEGRRRPLANIEWYSLKQD